MQTSTSVEETILSPSPVENGHSSNDSNLKPEAEQVSSEVDTETGEKATSETPADSEKHPQESSENAEATACSECEDAALNSERNAEGIADGQAEDQRPAVQTEHGKEKECCEGMDILAYC